MDEEEEVAKIAAVAVDDALRLVELFGQAEDFERFCEEIGTERTRTAARMLAGIHRALIGMLAYTTDQSEAETAALIRQLAVDAGLTLLDPPEGRPDATGP